MAYKRKYTRLPIQCQGEIQLADGGTPCTIVDLCEQGMRLRTDAALPIGDEFPLEFGLGKSRRLHCSIKIVRTAKSEYGAQIVTMPPDDRQYLTESLDDFIASNFGRY